ncbi:MAG: glycosyltransferase family 2 protein [Solirubrobacteraceae bacterium]|nr:glycosyltransferase family 2 protein [Solirubrobacteraceae bacterium]
MSRPSPADVTVVIPAHNRPALVEDCIASLLAQEGGAPGRILVVDDASTDDTADRAEAAGADVLRLTTNVRAAGARNRGLAEVTTSWVAFLDSDDLWLPTALSTLLAAADGHACASGAAAVFDGPAITGYRGPVPAEPTTVRDPAAMLDFEAELLVSGAVMTTESARAIEFDQSLRYSEDLDFWVRYLERNAVRSIPEPVLLYRAHEGGKSGDHAAIEGRRRIGASFAGRPWGGRALSDRYYGGVLWNAAGRAARARDVRRAARAALTIAARPARIEGARKRRERNASFREAYAGLPSTVAELTASRAPAHR